jgi:hypothetical protein
VATFTSSTHLGEPRGPVLPWRRWDGEEGPRDLRLEQVAHFSPAQLVVFGHIEWRPNVNRRQWDDRQRTFFPTATVEGYSNGTTVRSGVTGFASATGGLTLRRVVRRTEAWGIERDAVLLRGRFSD